MDLNHVEFKCYHFLISLDKCSGSCNILSPKIYLPKETKDINVKTFNMITKKNEAKTITNIFHVIVNANSLVQHVVQIKNGIMKHVNVSVKIIAHAKKIITGILAHALVKIVNVQKVLLIL